MKIKANVLIAVIYTAIVLSFCFWWSENYSRFVDTKGEESFYEIGIVSLITIVAATAFKLSNPPLAFWSIIVMPPLISTLSILITLFIPFSGMTFVSLKVYGIVHCLLSIAIYHAQLKADIIRRSPFSKRQMVIRMPIGVNQNRLRLFVAVAGYRA